MADTTDTIPTGRPVVRQAPPEHSLIAHQVHGWCSKCPGVELWEELHAWRQRERGLLKDQPATDQAPHPSREVERHG
ncbi:hypothetical protein [Streptomyces sp. SAI-127]|uniref:hypothetical protein n=1 Tax=Streptomyces sp. SAI-127 TaxID=2940543 RepID=UPI0024732230|nr:hypothetical protein [Streptomyces sp. SAI-127]MDH6489655.1 hypothetical protein [Streptomyces sp. SAI-127]